MVIFWAVAMAAFVVIEFVTVGLASIWFALGALCALIAAALNAPLWLQIVWFAVISAATLAITRPLVRKYVNARTHATNADRVIGGRAVVKERIDELAGTGAAYADGRMWTARTADGSIIEVGEIVTVREIRGVRLIVEAAAPQPPKATEAEIKSE